jgi:hypothetical protein
VRATDEMSPCLVDGRADDVEATNRVKSTAIPSSCDPAAKPQMRTEVHPPKEAYGEHYYAELAGEVR